MAVDCISKHRVFIHDRGGVVRLDEMLDIQSVKYSRVRDATSEANIKIAQPNCAAQRAVLDRIIEGCGRFEVVIYRGDERAWEGPTTIATDQGNGFELDAADVTFYWQQTVMHAAYSNAYPNIAYTIDRAKQILTAEMARKEALGYNLLSFYTYLQLPTDAKTSRVSQAYEKYVHAEIDDLAAKSGMDYAAIGRRVLFWDTDSNIGQTPALTNADFLGDGIIVSTYGSQLATRSIATDAQGGAGIAGGTDAYYGEVEILASPSEEDQNSGNAAPDQATLNSQAAANLTGKNPAPVVIRVADGASINPSGVLQLGDFVPGVFIPVSATINGRVVSQWQKLDKVTFTEDASGETIQVTLSPAPQGALIV